MEYRDELVQNRMDRVNSINLLFTDIQKSETQSQPEHIYDLGSFNITKTGKEIKDRLGEEVILKEKQDKQMFKEMLKCVEEIGEFPNTTYSRYDLKQYSAKLDVPKMYGSDQSYDVYNTTKMPNADKMYRYNEKAREYVDLCIEILKLKTIVNNIEEKKTFRLSSTMASKIGF